MPTTEEYCRAGLDAASAWGLEPTAVSLLNASENVVLRLDFNHGPKVMRLHRPGYNSLEELNSEVAWVTSLAEAGLPVLTAEARPDGGGHYHPIQIAAADGSTEVRYAGIIDWSDGEQLRRQVAEGRADVERSFRQLGSLMASIRQHSRHWTPPAGFTRRRWDSNGFVGLDPVWGRFWNVDQAEDSHRSLFSEARLALQNKLGELSTDTDRFGLIHADLHLANLLVTNRGLTMIDFDDFGWGWFMFEVAVALHEVTSEPWYPQARLALLEGYQQVSPLTDAEVAQIDTFLVVRSLMLVGWLADRPELWSEGTWQQIKASAEQRCCSYLS